MSGNASPTKPFTWRHAPTDNDPEHIVILRGWPLLNITSFACEPLARWTKGKSRIVTLNHSVKEDFLRLWDRWEKEGLLELLATKATPRWSGGWVARYKRGVPHDQNPRHLSNHASGHAFDICAPDLPFKKPVPQDHPIRQMVKPAAELGWHWGGDWAPRYDGMHFQHWKSPF